MQTPERPEREAPPPGYCARCGARFDPADPRAARIHEHDARPALRIRYRPQGAPPDASFVLVLPPQCPN
ncbi:hypothetical protein [Flaviaesturariibacter amylovorans]|uniref:C2H2-type domain-containing protein n=1 Tax=Flaviaesturariibacter amylovorans TaxID=1084520 RepID=A0ABP8HED3_9BACT